MSNHIKTAGLLVVGDEILSGRTQDKNTSFIARRLEEVGVQLQEVRVIADVIERIVLCVQEFSQRFDYVFTTGGIGPTHDDKTAEAVAQAFGVRLYQHPEAIESLLQHYGSEEHINDGRMKMAHVPEGASLIPNPVSAAPGFIIGNVHVMAGVPNIMQGMLNHVIPTLEGGDVVKTRDIIVRRAESEIADILQKIENEFAGIQIGSYPKYKDGQPEVTLILRGTDEGLLQDAFLALEQALTNKM